MLTFTLHGPPAAKARTRVDRRGRVYSGEELLADELRVRSAARVAVQGPLPVYPWQGVELVIVAVLDRPRTRPARVLHEDWASGAMIPAPVKPDWDNVGKLVSDALNGVAYADDGQVVRAVVETYYAAAGEAPRLHVSVGVFTGRQPALQEPS